GLWLQAAQLLAQIKDPAAVPLLKKLAKDPRGQVSEAATIGLAKTAPRDSIPELVAGLDGGDACANACAAELAKMGDAALTPLGAALAGGQTSAATALIAIGNAKSVAAVTDALPKLSWEKRGAVLESLTNSSVNPSWVSVAIGKIVQEARDGLAKKDEKLARHILQQVVLAAKSFGFPEAAQAIKLELRFIELSDRSPLPI